MTDDKCLVCENEPRRELVRASTLCGLDYLEVGDDAAKPVQLTVYFLGQAPEGWGKGNISNIRIDGGRRVRDIKITDLELYTQQGDEDDRMVVSVDQAGDFSTYTLSVVDVDAQGNQIDKPHHAFDPRYSSVDFNFNAGGTTELDCQAGAASPPEKLSEPDINYLAKDYASFRQLILDRLAVILPGWQEQHVPDIGVVLVEVLAYTGDYLSYYQDAVATEAYLDTSRQRVSVRRHARLMDYQMHEGCNSRAWVTAWVKSDLLSLKADDFYFITDPGLTGDKTVQETELPKSLPRRYLVFEPLLENRDAELNFYQAHNKIKIYTWGNTQCHLIKGSTSATLLDTEHETAKPVEDAGGGDPKYANQALGRQYELGKGYPEPAPEPKYKLELRNGDLVIFEEVRGPKSGLKEDADPSRRHVVRLTKVTQSEDPLNKNLLLEIEWASEDALPFSLCLSSINENDCSLIENVSVARGNVLLVDHGEYHAEDNLGQVPVSELKPSCDPFEIREVTKLAGNFTPQLERSDLTFSEPLLLQSHGRRHQRRAAERKPASAALQQDVRRAVPQIILYGFPATPQGSAAFGPADLVDPNPLAKELANHATERSRYLRRFFTGNTLKLLSSGKMTPELHQAVLDELAKLRERWEPRPDLLESDADDRHFVVEMDNDRRSHLRFGDDDSGHMPDAGTTFQAVYRVGDGPAGNVGAEAISHIVFRNNFPGGAAIHPRNPLAAVGGAAPEPVAEVKLFAPAAFRKELQRAIMADDYAAIVMRDFPDKVQRAVARLNWTGSRYEARVAIDPLGRESADRALLRGIAKHLYRFRKIGHDVNVVAATYVALHIRLLVRVLPHYLRGHVESDLYDLLSNRVMPDGRLGFFHPDILTFGEDVYLSRVIAAAQSVAGVQSVEVKEFHRFGEAADGEIESGVLKLDTLEIARLDNDANLPGNGVMMLEMEGGR